MLNIYLHEKDKEATIAGLSPKSKVSIVDYVSYENEIRTYYKGAEYPMKGLIRSEVMWSIDIVKALFIEVFKLRPNVVSILSSFNRIGNKIMGVYLLKDEYRMSGMKELDDIIYNFLFSYTSNDSISRQFSRIFSHLIEYDNAYRLRFVDIMSETDKAKLYKNPRKELKRLLLLMCSREVEHIQLKSKYKAVIFVLRAFLLLPKAKRAFRYAIEKSNIERMQYDDVDRYWACLRTDHNYMGLSSVERMKLLEDNGLSIPLQIEVV
jgi:hypothetical protein